MEIGTKIMYPKLKAGNKQRGPYLNSIYLQSSASDDSQIYVAKIPKIFIPSVLTSESESIDTKNKRITGTNIEVKQKPKASPILRPRAVVSSPDNDALIGNINRIEEKKAKKGLKSDDQIWSRVSHRKNITNVKISNHTVAKQFVVKSRDHK